MVDLTEGRVEPNLESEGRRYRQRGIDRSPEVAGVDRGNGGAGQLVDQLLCLVPTGVVELDVRLALGAACQVPLGGTVPDQVDPGYVNVLSLPVTVRVCANRAAELSRT